MAISDGYKAITTAWAATGDKTDPDDSSLTPPLDVEDGWPDNFSGADGISPRRRVMNEMYNRRDTALIDIRNHGILPYDSTVETPRGGIKASGNDLFQALEDTTAATSDATKWRNLRPALPTGAPSQVTGVRLSAIPGLKVVVVWNL